MRTYDPSQVSIIVGGVIIGSGFQGLTIGFDEDEATFTSGTGGETTRTKNASKLGTATLTITQASSENAALSALAAAGSAFSLAVYDNSGSSVHLMTVAAIAKRPDSEYGKESSDREWVIKGDLDAHLPAGNNAD